MNSIRELTAAMSKRNLLVVSAIAIFAVTGLLLVMPAHAQTTSSTTTSAGTQSGSVTSHGYSSGHNCPNMSGSTSSSSSSSSTTG